MHLLLTDRLTCPRCGPDFGLILLADHIRDRRVLEGEAGCSNCREGFSVRGGVCDLRWPRADDAAPDPTVTPAVSPDPDHVMRAAALLGIPGGPGQVLVVGESGSFSASLADLVQGIEFVSVAMGAAASAWGDADAASRAERDGVSRIAAGPERLPFFPGGFRGAVVRSGVVPVPEVVRVLAPFATLVVLDPGVDTRRAVEGAGFEVIAEDDKALVAKAPKTASGVASGGGRH